MEIISLVTYQLPTFILSIVLLIYSIKFLGLKMHWSGYLIFFGTLLQVLLIFVPSLYINFATMDDRPLMSSPIQIIYAIINFAGIMQIVGFICLLAYIIKRYKNPEAF